MVDCKFTDETKRLMLQAIESNEKLSKMFGFNLCLDQDNNISPSRPFIEGEKTYIFLSRSKCQPLSKEIGTFYSHSLSPTPSASSILTVADRGLELLCVGTSSKFEKGGPIERKVTCFEFTNREKLSKKQISENLAKVSKMEEAVKPFIKKKCEIAI